MSLETVTARIPREMLKDLQRIAERDQVDRSELIRRLLADALKRRRAEEALAEYARGRITLWRAADDAGVSLRDMMDLVKERRVMAPYTPEDLRRDLEDAGVSGQ